MKEPLLSDIDRAMEKLIRLLSLIDNHKINTVPFEGSWTPGQLAQHMVLSNGGFVQLMNGPTTVTSREPGEHVEQIRSLFLNFNIKFQSPEFIRPPKIEYYKQDLLEDLEKIRRELNDTIGSKDILQTVTLFEVPVMGYLTRLECAHFVLAHTLRHIHQLEKIEDTLNTKRFAETNA